MKRLYNIIAWVLLFIWQLPQNIVALVILPFVGKKKLLCTKRHAWCIFCRGMEYRGSISLGNFVLLGTDRSTTIAHELGHVWDSHWMGPLYLIIIGLPSIIWAGFDIYLKKGVSYYSLYTERHANKHSHIHDERNTYANLEYWHLEWDEGYDLRDIK